MAPARPPIRLALGLALTAACAGAAIAEGAGPALSVSADTHDRGYVGLRVTGTPGATVDLAEQLKPGKFNAIRAVRLGSSPLSLRHALPWSCDRRTRRIVARATNPDRSVETDGATVHTPSCHKRLSLSVRPRRVRVGRRFKVAVGDRFGVGGVRLRVCTTPPAGRARCRNHKLVAGKKRLTLKVRTVRVGATRVEARIPGVRAQVHRFVRAQHRGGRVTVLATGDSMIQILDDLLARRLGGRHHGHVRKDAHISTGISKPAMLNWQTHAANSAHRVRPDVTVMFIGANDGFPMTGPHGRVDCCGSAWSDEYARRARNMMASYARHGHGHVYWLLLPTPRGGFFRQSFPAVNAGLRRAARKLRSDVDLIHLEKVFTPGGHYRGSIVYHGHRINARQKDGVHLSTAGASLAAGIVAARMRHDHLIR